jgi:periplasmic protein TonB
MRETIAIQDAEEPLKTVDSAPPPDRTEPRRSSPPKAPFHSPLLENNRMKAGSRLLDAVVSVAVNLCLLIVPVFAGMFFTDSLDLKQFATTFLVAPPPPPPPPPAVTTMLKPASVHRVFEHAGGLIAPTVIPQKVTMLKEEPLADIGGSDGVPGGVPGGVAGGSMGGVIGGVIGGTAVPVAPPAKEKTPRTMVRVGGRVKEPRLIQRVEPKYPQLAIMTHLDGDVVIEAIIDEQGNVVEAQVVSGPVLLMQSALDAVRNWKYEPTYLNEQPVSVQLKVIVSFRLTR